MHNRNYGCRITKSLKLKEIDAIVMENSLLRITILVGKGTDIYEFLYKPKDIDFAWRSPNELHNPKTFVPTTSGEDGTFMDHYTGGFQEILPNAGPSSKYKGTIIGQHGETCNIPWEYEIVKNDIFEIAVKFYVRTYRTPFYIEKTLTLKKDDSTLYIEEKLTNEGNEELQFMWGHHPAIGEPFLCSKCTINTNAKTLISHPKKAFPTQRTVSGKKYSWPTINSNNKVIDFSKVPNKEANCADLVYLTDFDENGMYEVINSSLNLSFGMTFDKDIFSYLWFWQVCSGSYGYPWYGKTYNLALEPFTSFPSSGIEESIRNGSCKSLKAKESISTKLTYFIHKKE